MRKILFAVGLIVAALSIAILRALIFESMLPKKVAVLTDDGQQLNTFARVGVDIDTFAMNHSWLTAIALIALAVAAWRYSNTHSKEGSAIIVALRAVGVIWVPLTVFYLIVLILIILN